MLIQANIYVFIFLLLFCILLFFFNKISLKSFCISSQSVFPFFTHLHGKWRHFDLNGRKHNTDVNRITYILIFYGSVSMSWFFMNNNDNSYNLRSLPLSTMCYEYYFMPSSSTPGSRIHSPIVQMGKLRLRETGSVTSFYSQGCAVQCFTVPLAGLPVPCTPGCMAPKPPLLHHPTQPAPAERGHEKTGIVSLLSV